MLGAIIGDIIGSRFEFNNYRSPEFELFHPDCTFTDDTICTMAVADWMIHGGDLSKIMRRWCRKYPSSYGTRFQQWINDVNMGPYNSFGNGAAMRVSPCGWVGDLEGVMNKAAISASVTHNHPEGIKGAECIADLIWRLRNGQSKTYIAYHCVKDYGYKIDLNLQWLQEHNQFDETCQVTVPQAIACFIQSSDFESAIRLAVSIGGDSDTIAAITGSLAEAHYGIPWEITKHIFDILPKDMLDVISKFTEKTKFK